MSGGFIGGYAVVDLSSGATEKIELAEDFFRKFLSGYGLGAAVITERQPANIGPLSPHAHLGFCSGLLTGTGAPFSGRFMVAGKSPLTGTWGDANCGGYLSREMKRAGFDAIFFTGRAEKPVWVSISDGKIEIMNASSLWGMDTVQTEETIRHELGDRKVRVATIGVSGEKLSLISGVVTEGGRIAARSGLGALMGSKNLKAVAFRGSGKVPVARPQEVKDITAGFMSAFKSEPRLLDKVSIRFMNFVSKLLSKTGIRFPAEPGTVREIWRRWGTCGTTLYSALIGDMPIRNWDGSGYVDYTFEMALRVSAENVINHQEKRFACQGCPLGCGGIIEINAGRYRGTQGHKPEYETLAAFGGLLMHDDLEGIIELNEMCNRAGLDTISAGGAVAFAVECFEKGLIDQRTTNGLRLGWGRTEEIIKLTDMIINREGLGDLLADGVRVAAQKLGTGSEAFAVHAGGQELPMHDSRLDPGYAIAYSCEPTPGRHTIASYQDIDLRSGRKQFPEAGRMARQAKTEQSGKVALYTATSIYAQIINCAGLCLLGADSTDYPIVDYLNAVTGWDLSADEYFKTGKRILALRKAFNVREGIRPQNTRLHDRALGRPPQTKGPLKGKSVDAQPLQEAFYRLLGYDPATGGPTPETLMELDIAHLFPSR
ncbi:MAG TPA: aldehyde ferredoxin oxidoreductase family protein [bacterium]|nr:aldehyde ferredoxin oxidoreductase family protein [bacterium]